MREKPLLFALQHDYKKLHIPQYYKAFIFPHSTLEYTRESLLLCNKQPFLGSPETRSENPENLWNVVLETEGGRLVGPKV